MKKYDGWVIKVQFSGKPYFLSWHFHEKRTDVIKSFNDASGELWRKYRRRGTHEIVKIKLVEMK